VLSADGRYVAFQSDASNLVAGDTNGVRDVFVRDRQTGAVSRVSVSSDGTQGNSVSSFAKLSGDGRYVVFYSTASTLVAGDTNGVADTFVHDRQTGTTTRISVSSTGAQANGESLQPTAISADGRYAAFTSRASTLVAGDTNGLVDVFVRDLGANTTVRVSVGAGGAQGNRGNFTPSLSADGRYVAFTSLASNLVAGDTNEAADVFRHDRDPDADGIFDEGNGVTVRLSLTGAGEVGLLSNRPGISGDGNRIVFGSASATLVAGDTNGVVDVFVADVGAGTTRRVSVDSASGQANGASEFQAISGNGLLVAFHSDATNLVAGDTNGVRDVFTRVLATGTTVRQSVSTAGAQGNGASDLPALSGDGRYVVFSSTATNLVAGDTNGVQDVFLRGPLP
jgi:Tol biopolymer transport system component